MTKHITIKMELTDPNGNRVHGQIVITKGYACATFTDKHLAQKLYEAAGDPRYLWTEAGVNHVGLYSMYPEMYEERVVSFFDAYLLQINE